ncbi:hypothetical protein BB560_000722 [Smittium megazygosporum]|uniref:Uncharacterized protein n=1 Tax=Smittium megazygosporum TaxID=133381 RepID=A0A2T9ZJI1_9FUNG|nr:hypothetical protein BB560_000722 [Smittium megazygosporum]
MESAELPLLENIRKMHSACKSRPGTSSSVLALVSQVYTLEQLKDFEFEFSSNQYSLSRKNASDENFTLVDYERHSPTSKTEVSDETKAKVSDILYEFSSSSSSTISLGTAGNGYQEIRYLTKPKRDIYYELKEKHPGIQLSLKITNIRPLLMCFEKSGDLVQRRYYKYLSENISHDSLYAINCLKDLLCRSEFQEFEEVNLWSDSENRGKSDVDDHFGVLSRWFKEIERNRCLSSIEDSVSVFKEKSQVSENISDNNRVYNFQIYRKDAIRGLRIRAKVSNGFRNYLSFYLGDGGLMACPLSLPDSSKYFNIGFRIKVKRDIRTNKYAPDRSNPLGSGTDIMGCTSRNTQRTRMEMLRGIGVSLSS